MVDPQDRRTDDTDDPRAGMEDAHEFGIVLAQREDLVAANDDDAGEALEVLALAGFVG